MICPSVLFQNWSILQWQRRRKLRYTTIYWVLQKHKNFHIIIVQASQEYYCFHSTLNFCSVVVGISCCPIALSSFPYFILIHSGKNQKTSCFCAIIFGTKQTKQIMSNILKIILSVRERLSYWITWEQDWVVHRIFDFIWVYAFCVQRLFYSVSLFKMGNCLISRRIFIWW